MRNVVVFTPPPMRPLPTYVDVARINAVPLPVKVESARRAIALCEDLPEIERYRDQADGLAAAVKIMKHTTPAMVRSVNLMYKEAIDRMGVLLIKTAEAALQDGAGEGRAAWETTKASRAAGISDSTKSASMHFAARPAALRRAVIENDDVPPKASKMASVVDPHWRAMLRRPKTRRSPWFKNWLLFDGLHRIERAAALLEGKRGNAKLDSQEGKAARAAIARIQKMLMALRDTLPQ